MTTKEINKALRENKIVVLRDDPMSRISRDLFGNLIVTGIQLGARPVRLATLSDKRQAKIIED